MVPVAAAGAGSLDSLPPGAAASASGPRNSTAAQAISHIKFDKVVVWDGGAGNGGKNATAGFLHGLRTSKPAKEVQKGLLERGILAGTSGDPNVVRLLPPYILKEQHVDLLREALASL